MADSDTAPSAGSPVENVPPPVRPDPSPEPRQSLIEIAFPTQATLVFFSALALGLVLICAATFFQRSLGAGNLQANLILCVGVALILAAFGGQATMRVGGIILAGVAAVAIGLFAFMHDLSKRELLTGELRVDLTRFKEPTISANQNTLRGVLKYNKDNPKRSHFTFVIFRDELRAHQVEIALVNRTGEGEVALSVPVSALEWAFSDRRNLTWELRRLVSDGEESFQIYDSVAEKIVSRDLVASVPSQTRWTWLPSIVSSAFAQSQPTLPESIRRFLDQLGADDLVLRRGARDALAAAGIDGIPQMMQEFRRNFDDYRTRLGVCVALTQMMRADKSKAPQIAGRLTEDDLRLLVRAAGDRDRTVRIYATEFLFDLGDPRASKIAVANAATTSDDTARYNWVFLAQDGWRKLSPAEKGELSSSLLQARKQSGDRTRALIDKMI